MVLDGAVEHSPLIPKQPAIAGWMSGIGERLGFRVFLIALAVATVAYAGLLALSFAPGERAISRRWAFALIGALHLVIFLGPVLLSTDVFSYIAYARMGVEHGINPYLHGPAVIANDPVFKYVGHDWRQVAIRLRPAVHADLLPAGPARRRRGAVGDEARGAARELRHRWRSSGAARRRASCDPLTAVLIVGVNPLYLIYGLGGAHNDLLMMLAMMAAVALTLTRREGAAGARREAWAAAIIVAGALVKATVAALLPFMIVSRRRLAPIVGALGALVAGGLIGYLVFGRQGIDVVSALNRDSGVRLDRQLRERDRPSVRKGRRVPGRSQTPQGLAGADRRSPAVAHMARLRLDLGGGLEPARDLRHEHLAAGLVHPVAAAARCRRSRPAAADRARWRCS